MNLDPPTPVTDGPVVLLAPTGLDDVARAALLERARSVLGEGRIVLCRADADPRALLDELGELPALVLDARDDARLADVLAAAVGGDVGGLLEDAAEERARANARRTAARTACEHLTTGSDGKGRPVCLACGVRVVRLVVDPASGKVAGQDGVTLRTRNEPRPGKAERKATKRAKRDARRALEATNGATFAQLVADAIDDLKAGPTAAGMTEGRALARLRARPWRDLSGRERARLLELELERRERLARK